MLRIKTLALLGLPLALSAGCESSGDAVKHPTWLEDIRPIVQANCLRCHTPPSLGGAPTDFRLDVYEDTLLTDGRVIRGARTMARFMAVRAGEEGTMPPDFPRDDGQRDSFVNWWADGAPLGGRSRNRQPNAKLLTELSPVDSEPLTLEYEVSDSDGDLVHGTVRIGDRIVDDSLHSGRGRFEVFPGTLEEGEHRIVALVDDDLSRRERTLGTLVVSHASGNTCPTVALANSLHDGLISDRQFPLNLDVVIADPDAGDTLTFNIVAFRGNEEIEIDRDVAAVVGENSYVWTDAAALPEGPGWRLRIVVSDQEDNFFYESERFYVSHQETDLVYADVEPLLYEACAACHRSPEIPGPSTPNFIAGENPKAELDALRGRIYRRVILEGTMPPPSAAAIAREESLPWRALSADEKASLAEYLLGGSPD